MSQSTASGSLRRLGFDSRPHSWQELRALRAVLEARDESREEAFEREAYGKREAEDRQAEMAALQNSQQMVLARPPAASLSPMPHPDVDFASSSSSWPS